MKKRIMIIAVLVAVVLLICFRYSVVEREDVLPDPVRLGLSALFGTAYAEEAPSASAQTAPEPTTGPVLQRGDRGDEVKALQQRLRDLGFLTGSADGVYGEKTEQAVASFRSHLHDLEQEAHAARLAEAERRAADELEALTPMPASEENSASPGDTHNTSATEDHAADSASASTNASSAENHAEGNDSTNASATGDHAASNTASDNEDHSEVNTASGNTSSNGDLAAGSDSVPGSTHNAPVIAPILSSRPAQRPTFDGTVDETGYYLLLEDGFDEYQRLLSGGSRGAEVRRLQNRLRSLGYLKGSADGVFGDQTARAVTAFQKRHQLTQDGVAGEKTQRALYSASAKRKPQPTTPYLLKVSTEKQRVYAYAWDENDDAYTRLTRTMVCSTGLADTPTPKGTFTSTTAPVVRWGYFPKYDVWAQYLYRIQGPYLFHSVLYDEADESTVRWGSVNKLGSPASHGCIRLDVPDAKWIYNNCPAGTTVQVY